MCVKNCRCEHCITCIQTVSSIVTWSHKTFSLVLGLLSRLIVWNVLILCVCVCVFLYIYEDIYPPQSYFEFLVILYAANLYFINLLHGQCLPGGDSSVNVYFVYSMLIVLNTYSKKLDHIFLAFIPALWLWVCTCNVCKYCRFAIYQRFGWFWNNSYRLLF